jgi:hypothetical protein
MDWRRLKNDETMMSRKDPWALTAAGSAIPTCGVLKAPIKGSCESRLRIGDAWNFRRDEVAAKRLDLSYFYLASVVLLNKRRGTFFPSDVLCGASKKGTIGMLALANPNPC